MATQKRPGYWQAMQRDASGKKCWGFGRTAEDAEDDALRKAGKKTSREILGKPRSGSLTAFVERYVFDNWRELEPTTQARYMDEWEKRIKPEFGDLPIGSITSDMVRDWLRDMATGENPRSPYARRYSRAVLYGIMQEAFMMEKIDSNPVARVKPPKVVKNKVDRILRPVEAQRLLEQVRGSELSGPVYIAATLCLREAEVAGLKWEDFSPEGLLTVQRQRQTLYRRTVDGKLPRATNDKAPKRNKVRKFTVPPQVIDEIRARTGTSEGYVCLKDGKPWRAQTLSRWWSDAAERFGMPEWTFHDLRHLAIGSLRAAGADMKLIQAIAGHTDPRQTADYQAILDNEPSKAFGKVDRARRKAIQRTTR